MPMIKGFVVDYIRQVIEQTMLEEKLKDNRFFGGDDEVRLFSFYEQLATRKEIDRYVENYGQLVDQQNKTNLIMNGIIITDETPTVTNISKGFSIPTSFTGAVRVRVEDKDNAVETFNNLISVLKGRKQDICGFSYTGDKNTEAYVGKPFKVGTIGNSYEDNGLIIHNGDFVMDWNETNYINDVLSEKLTQLNTNYGITTEAGLSWVYVRGAISGRLYVAFNDNGVWKIVENDGNYQTIIFPPKGTFDRYKMSMSFDSIKISYLLLIANIG